MSFSSKVKEEISRKLENSRETYGKGREAVDDLRVRKTYIREMFIFCGYVNDPAKAYYIEFAEDDPDERTLLLCRLSGFGISMKTIVRKGRTLIYSNNGEVISDLLNLLGAHQCLMEFENARILKEMRENIQRQVNCETANIHKTAQAFVRQSEDIEYIDAHMGISELPENLREIAELRLNNPSASLSELAEALSVPVSRSGVNHRLRKLSAIAEKLRAEQKAK